MRHTDRERGDSADDAVVSLHDARRLSVRSKFGTDKTSATSPREVEAGELSSSEEEPGVVETFEMNSIRSVLYTATVEEYD